MLPALNLCKKVRDYVTGSPEAAELNSGVDSAETNSDSSVRPDADQATYLGTDARVALAQNSKRRRRDESAEETARSTKRARRASSDERRLMGNYTSGADAKRIEVPVQSVFAPTNNSTRMPQGPNTKVFRPMNTLGQPPVRDTGPSPPFTHSGQAGRARKLSSSVRPDNYGPDRRARDTQTFETNPKSPGQTNEGQDTRMNAAVSSSPGNPIDLTSDDENLLRHETIATDTGTQTPSRATRRPPTRLSPPMKKNHFDNRESRKIDSFTRFPLDKAHGIGSSESNPKIHRHSTASTPLRADHFKERSPVRPYNVSRALRKDLEREILSNDADASWDRYLASTSAMHAPRSMQGTLLPGASKTPDHRHQWHTSDILSRKQNPKNSNFVEKLPPGTSKHHAPSNELAVAQFYANASRTSGADSNVSNFFSRLDKPVAGPKLKAKDRMHATSDVNQHRHDRPRISMGSEDELAGATTISSNAFKLHTDFPSAYGRIQSLEKSDEMRSDLEPSYPLTPEAVSSTTVETVRSKYFDQRENNTPESGEVRIPIRSLYCQSCILDQDGIELAWDDDRQAFKVRCNGAVQMVPGDPHVFLIDKSTGKHEWLWCEEMLCAYVKGSKTQFDNGSMLIEFENKEGAGRCWALFGSASYGNLRMQSVEPAKMEKLVEKQRSFLKTAFERATNPALKTTAAQPVTPDTVPQPLSHVDSHERILYESHSRSPSVQQSSKEHASDPMSIDSAVRVPDPSNNRRSSRRLQTVTQQRHKSPTPERWTRTHNPAPWTQPVTYPATGVRRVTVDFQDLDRLDEGECLNDNLVDFAVRQIEESMEPQHKRDVHFFNSFFFSALSSKNGRRDFNYDAVKRWTRATDLFTIPYIVVPINMEYHWFIAIICNLPALQRRLLGSGDETQADEAKPLAPDFDDNTIHKAGKHNSDHDRARASPEAVDSHHHQLSSPGADVALSSRESIPKSPNHGTHRSGPRAPDRNKKRPVGRRYSSNDTVIMTLDSLGVPRTTEIRYLKQYIGAEAKEKRAMVVENWQLFGITAKGVPEQSNFTDCGVYLVGYLEEFAKNPRRFVNKVLSREMQETEFENFRPSVKRAEIRNALLGLYKEQEAVRVAHKEKKREAKRQAARQAQGEATVQDPSSQPIQEPVVDEQRSVSNGPRQASEASDSGRDHAGTEKPQMLLERVPECPSDLSTSNTTDQMKLTEGSGVAPLAVLGTSHGETASSPPASQDSPNPAGPSSPSGQGKTIKNSSQEGVAILQSPFQPTGRPEDPSSGRQTVSSGSPKLKIPDELKTGMVVVPKAEALIFSASDENSVDDFDTEAQFEELIVEVPDSQETRGLSQQDVAKAGDLEF